MGINLEYIDMKKFLPNIVVIACLLGVVVYYQNRVPEDPEYWSFIGNHMVFNIGVALIGLAIGIAVKNYWYVFIGASFSLIVYCLAFSFKDLGLMGQFFLALYTVFLGFSALGNLARHFKDWVLLNEQSI
jgi:uncharacterized membrane protein YczE